MFASNLNMICNVLGKLENIFSENLVHVKQNIDGQDLIAVEKLQMRVKYFLFSFFE